MKRLPRFAVTTWLTAVVVVLLPTLAALQYRWLSHVGVDAVSRMRAVAVNASRALADDLAFELHRAWREQAGVTEAPGAGQPAEHPPFIVDALVVDATAARGGLDPFRWNLASGACDRHAWPTGYDGVRSEVRAHLGEANGRAARSLQVFLRREGASRGFLAVGADTVARARGGTSPCGAAMPAIVLFRLDLAAIRDVLLPELSRRHLASLEADFRFAIVSGPNGGETIYVPAGSDATTIADRPDVEAALGFAGRDLEGGPRGDRDGEPFGRGTGRNPRDHGGRREGWVLVGQHRAGSLDAAVASLRTRNLAISFAVLLLLAVVVALIAQNARRAERLMRQQVDFVAAVSHEMRTPVAAIDVTARNLEDGLVTDPAKVIRYGSAIRAEAGRLAATVERVFEFAALDGGRAPGAAVDVDVEALIRDVSASARLEYPDAAVEVAIDGPLDLVRADPAVLRSCVQNLVGNALKYGGMPGWVRIRAGCSGTPRETRIEVEDRGPGIDSRDVPHVFEPFYRGRLARERCVPGNGLGLHIVKRSLDMMGGRVSLTTAPARGTVVTLHLPSASDVPGVGAPGPADRTRREA